MWNSKISIVSAVFLLFLSNPLQAYSFNEELVNPVPVVKMAELLKVRSVDSVSASGITVESEKLHASAIIGDFYSKRDFQPVWVFDSSFLVVAAELTDAINAAYFEGLVPEHYHLDQINSAINKARKIIINDQTPSAEVLVDLDLLLSDAFLMLSCHYSSGCENPAAAEAEWFTDTEKVDVTALLEMSSRERRIKEALNDLLPPGDNYLRLKDALAEYRSIAEAGGWPLLSKGPILAVGAVDSRVVELRSRLRVSGDLMPDNDTGVELFDTYLKEAVLRFQGRHGLRADGLVGHRTRNALNVSAEYRTRKIELNLERLRWSRNAALKNYLLVNIADFRLDVIENGSSVMNMKVVVGRPYWDTPVFSEEMTEIVFSPSWNIPNGIALNEVIPNIIADSEYLEAQNIAVLNSWRKNAVKINPASVDWKGITEKNLIYQFRQMPGPLNPLGRVKFMFPNRFNVYMHDTPTKNHFNNNTRVFSHGCIRLERPLELAEYLLKGTAWFPENIRTAIKDGNEMEVQLAEPVSVQIIYLTAWVDTEGKVQFRNDIYGRDRRLINVLNAQK